MRAPRLWYVVFAVWAFMAVVLARLTVEIARVML